MDWFTGITSFHAIHWASSSTRFVTVCVAVMGMLTACGTPKQHSGEASNKPPKSDVLKQVFKSTFVATAKAPVVASKTGAVIMRERLHVLIPGNLPTAKFAAGKRRNLPDHAGGEAFETYLDRNKLPIRTSGSLQFYVDGTSFFPIYLRAVAHAKQRVDAQTFIFDSDPFAISIADALKTKSKEVPVRVYFDDMGSKVASRIMPPSVPKGYLPPKDIKDYLMAGSNVQVRRTLNPYMAADHCKLHIIDQRTAFVGGMNIGEEYHAPWHDLMAKVEGPVVMDLLGVYERHWRNDTWWRRLGSQKPANGIESEDVPSVDHTKLQALRLLLTDISNGRKDIHKTALIAINCASRRIWIQTPYFSSDDITTALQAALQRGVDVRIVIPGKNDSGMMETGNVSDLKKLIKDGAKVYACPGMTHLKATICDDWAMFGSANYDTLSMRVNRELNLATSDKRTVNAIATRVFHRDFGRSPLITRAMAEARGDAMHEFLGDQL